MTCVDASPLAQTTDFQPVDRAAIDASCAVPVGAFYVSAVLWLIIGSLLAGLASFKLHMPEFFSGSAAWTFGRVRPAHVNVSIYGWATLGGIGTLLWLQARLCRVTLPFPSLLTAGCMIWNVALAIGTIAILTGSSTGVEYLELPALCVPAFAGVFGIVVFVSLVMFAGRRERTIHVSQWYLFAAALWFPLLYLLANVVVHGGAAHGVPQALAGWWYAHNLLGLWLAPIGLAAAYYLIPTLIQRPIYSAALSSLGFWTLAIFYHWAGAHHLIGGPLPAWLVSIGIVAGVLMLIPVTAVAVNLHMTMRGCWNALRNNLPLRFIVIGAMCYTAVSLQGALQALRTVNAVTHFTHYTVAHAHLGVYAFFTMLLFGVLYYVLPRILGKQEPPRLLMELHFWSSLVGIALFWLALTFGGVWQGLLLNNPDVPFLDIVRRMNAFLGIRTIAAYFLTIGHLLFAWQVWRMCRTPRSHAEMEGAR